MLEQKQNKEEIFKIKELCWAKIKGFPWWPAIIRNTYVSNDKKYYFVGYICEKNGSVINENTIKKWETNYGKFKDFKINSKNGKNSTMNNDFKCALIVANMYYEGKIDDNDHEIFINKYQNNKDRHNLVHIQTFFNNIIKEKEKLDKGKLDKKKMEIKIVEKEKLIKSYKNNNKIKTNLIGKKRNISKESKDKIQENINEKKEKEKENIIKNNEINMTQKELNKIDDIISNITHNIDEIMTKSEKYQKFFAKECKEKNICIHDNKSIKTKIELIKYLQIMTDILNVPISLNNIFQNINKKNN